MSTTHDKFEIIHFRSRRKRAPKEQTALTLNLAPMVDVVFLLLIFFIVTTDFRRPEGLLASRLPQQSGQSQSVALPISPIIITVKQTGPTPSDYKLHVEGFTTAPQTFTDLTTFLKEVKDNPGFDDKTPVVIQAADDVQWDHIVGCWNAGVRAGFKHISFGQAK